MKTSGLDIPDNCTLIFHANGIKVRVSLNIPSVISFIGDQEKLTILFKMIINKQKAKILYKNIF